MLVAFTKVVNKNATRLENVMPLTSARWLLPVAFLAYLLVESLAFTSLANTIGFLPTFLLAVAKPVLGGLFVMARLRHAFAGLKGRRGAGALSLTGARISRALAGAVLLVVPGFVSGALGLVLLWPPAGMFAGGASRMGRRPADPKLVDLDATQWREGGRAAPPRMPPRDRVV